MNRFERLIYKPFFSTWRREAITFGCLVAFNVGMALVNPQMAPISWLAAGFALYPLATVLADRVLGLHSTPKLSHAERAEIEREIWDTLLKVRREAVEAGLFPPGSIDIELQRPKERKH